MAEKKYDSIIDAFLDLAVEEDLQTAFLHGENNVDDDAVAAILNYPNSIIGLSDGGAHVQFEIDDLMLRRVAGNVYECPSTKDFWKVNGNKIVKLVGNEVNQGESIQAAPEDRPAAFLAGILDDLEF